MSLLGLTQFAFAVSPALAASTDPFPLGWGGMVTESVTNPIVANAVTDLFLNSNIQWTRGQAWHLAGAPRHAAILVPLGMDAPRSPWASILSAKRGRLWSTFTQTQTLPLPRLDQNVYWELGNEPDFYTANTPPHVVAAQMKAAAWGLWRRQPDARTLMPGLALPPGPFIDQLFANDIQSYTVGWNAHFYGWVQDLPGVIQRHRHAQMRWRAPTPFFLTELGYAETLIGRESLEVEQLRQKTFFQRAACESAAAQISLPLLFSLTPYRHEGLEFGLSSGSGLPRLALQSVQSLFPLLQRSLPRFRIQHTLTEDPVGLVFEITPHSWLTILGSPRRRSDFPLPPMPTDSSSQSPAENPLARTSHWTVHLRFPDGIEPQLWSIGTPLDRALSLPQSVSLSVSATNNLFLFTHAFPFDVAECRWTEIPSALRPSETLPLCPAPSPVVVDLEWDPHHWMSQQNRWAYELRRKRPTPVTVRLYNFSPAAVQGRLRLEMPPLWSCQSPRLNRSFRLPPESDLSLPLVLTPLTEIPEGSDPRGMLKAIWIGERGDRDSAAARFVHPESSWNLRFDDTEWFWTRPKQSGAIWAPLDRVGEKWVYQKSENENREGHDFLVATLPIEERWSLEDRFRCELRVVTLGSLRSHCRVKWEFITPNREVLGDGRLLDVHGEWSTQTFEVRDLGPVLWSRATREAAKMAPEIRHLRLTVFGLEAGAQIELRNAIVEQLKIRTSLDNTSR